jgi:hypothetical protein
MKNAMLQDIFFLTKCAFYFSIVDHNERIPSFRKIQVLLKQNHVNNVSFTAWFESETLGTQISFANSSCEIQKFCYHYYSPKGRKV